MVIAGVYSTAPPKELPHVQEKKKKLLAAREEVRVQGETDRERRSESESGRVADGADTTGTYLEANVTLL